MHWFFYIARAAVKAYFFVFTRLKIKGRENITRDRPLIVVANHITFAEPPIIGTLLKGHIRFAAKEGLFRSKFTKYFMEALGCFPVYQKRADRKIIRLMEQYVADGYALVIFPEGTRSKTAELLPALTGAALIARNTNALILPVGIFGTEKLRQSFWFLKRPVVNANFGKPFHLPADKAKLNRGDATKYLMERITDLLPPEYHGVYAGKKRDGR